MAKTKKTLQKIVIKPNKVGILELKTLINALSIPNKLKVESFYSNSERILFSLKESSTSIEALIPKKFNSSTTITVYKDKDFNQVLCNIKETASNFKLEVESYLTPSIINTLLKVNTLKKDDLLSKYIDKKQLQAFLKKFYEDDDIDNMSLDNLANELEGLLYEYSYEMPDWVINNIGIHTNEFIEGDEIISNFLDSHESFKDKFIAMLNIFKQGYFNIKTYPSNITLMMGYDIDSELPFISQLPTNPTTIEQAHKDLLPKEFKTLKPKNYLRQGEYFFVPVNKLDIDWSNLLINDFFSLNNFYGKVSNRNHIARYAFVYGGDVYVTGKIEATNHKTLNLRGLYKVYRNAEVEIEDAQYD